MMSLSINIRYMFSVFFSLIEYMFSKHSPLVVHNVIHLDITVEGGDFT